MKFPIKFHLLEERKTKLEALRHALIEGEESGIADYTLHDLLDSLDDNV